MKRYEALFLSTLYTLLSACSGESSIINSDDDESRSEFADCIIVMNTLSLSSGETCYLNKTAANLYGISAGELSCLSGMLKYGGNQFSSGNTGSSFNGLNVSCES